MDKIKSNVEDVAEKFKNGNALLKDIKTLS